VSKVQEVLDLVKGMTVVELAELVKAIEQEFGVSAAAQLAMAPTAGPAAGGAAAVEAEKVEFDAILTSFGDQKVQVIKVVRELTGLGLKEAKDLVEGVPKPVKQKVSKEEAQKAVEKLKEAGAAAEIN